MSVRRPMSDQAASRRESLSMLLDLAQKYRGWTRKELAKRLHRDPTKLIPGSGVPKLDLVVSLAGVLDWPVEEVVAKLCGSEDEAQAEVVNESFETMNTAAKQAHRDGQNTELVSLAQKMYRVAETADERALACNRETGGWDGLGRYSQALEAVQRGLQEGPLSTNKRVMLEINLANAHYSLWHLFEARATAANLIERYVANPPVDRTNEVVRAFAHYVRGHSLRRMMDVDMNERDIFARLALEDIERARDLYLELADRYEDDSYRGVANTCVGGLYEVDVVLGHRSVEQALDMLGEGLDRVVDTEVFPSGDLLESYGWWSIFGCNIALRHIDDERVLQQHMAVFTNKAQEIAERMDNWAMRERVFTMEYARRQRFLEWTGVNSDWTIDRDDVRIVTGTMGRFPSFRKTGWSILQNAKLIES